MNLTTLTQTHTQRAVAHARRVNRLVVEHKKAGDKNAAEYCAGMRALWMAEARRSN